VSSVGGIPEGHGIRRYFSSLAMGSIEDISNWQGKISQAVPIGKRVKRTMYKPDDYSEFYFKEPEAKYPWEFWTEIVAYRIGQRLKFKTLEYRPVIYKDKAGCLSPSMVRLGEDLIHGQQYLTQLMPDFDKKTGSDHSFQIVEKLFTGTPDLTPLFKDFIQMLVFDAVIGNHDRHQQNWAIIRRFNFIMKDETAIDKENYLERFIRWLVRAIDKILPTKGPVLETIMDIDSIHNEFLFSPLFDNGNSLAYNILEQNIEGFLKDENRLKNYLFGGKAHSHIRWNGGEVGYIELLEKVKELYPTEVEEGIQLVAANFDKKEIEMIIMEADKDFPLSHSKYALTLPRKQLMFKIVEGRTEELLRRLT